MATKSSKAPQWPGASPPLHPCSTKLLPRPAGGRAAAPAWDSPMGEAARAAWGLSPTSSCQLSCGHSGTLEEWGAT